MMAEILLGALILEVLVLMQGDPVAHRRGFNGSVQQAEENNLTITSGDERKQPQPFNMKQQYLWT